MIRVYGSRISYYTGKLEAYLRYRGIDYELLPTIGNEREIRAGAGTVQMPSVRLDDGRWMSDTTPILAWFEAQREGSSIYPTDPAMRFVALLLEDHADEWLWRPAMHYRWSFLQDREHASGVLADELLTEMELPRLEKRQLLIQRQLGGFVEGEGVSPSTRGHVERTVMTAYEQLEAILAERPFLLGDRPTIADYGFMGPMFRHLSQDPTPAELMREHAPAVYVWVARMWEARFRGSGTDLLSSIDAPLSALLEEVCETHLVQLRENARAHAEGLQHFGQQVQGCDYEGLPVSRYRVWCLEELRRLWRQLDDATQATLRAHLPETHASVLWDEKPIANSGYDADRLAPFNHAINVFGSGVPS